MFIGYAQVVRRTNDLAVTTRVWLCIRGHIFVENARHNIISLICRSCARKGQKGRQDSPSRDWKYFFSFLTLEDSFFFLYNTKKRAM